MNMKHKSIWNKYSFAWITLAFFLISLALHWVFGWYAFVNEQHEHGQPVEMQQYLIEMGRDTFENWQSEFLQLIWQVAGLAAFLYLGSPQSKEGDDRKEAKLDALLELISPEGKNIIHRINKNYDGDEEK
jgi:hypothetical protein